MSNIQILCMMYTNKFERPHLTIVARSALDWKESVPIQKSIKTNQHSLMMQVMSGIPVNIWRRLFSKA